MHVTYPGLLVTLLFCCISFNELTAQELFRALPFTDEGTFTEGIEGPGCDQDGNLYVVNMAEQQTLAKLTPDGRGEIVWRLPGRGIGNGIVFGKDGALFVADYVEHRIHRFDPNAKTSSVFASSTEMHQPNDLAISRAGRIYASDPDWEHGTGQLWMLPDSQKASEPVRLATGLGTTNGIEVSPDDRWLYVNESNQRSIYRYPIDADGRLGDRELLIQFEAFGLDGMRCDVEGNLYVARYHKGTIDVVSPAGAVVREIEVLGSRPSNLCFGGKDGRTVYVTEVEHRRIVTFRCDTPGLSWQRWQP